MKSIFYFSFSTGGGGFFQGLKTSEMMFFVIYSYVSYVTFGCFVLIHTRISRFIIFV